MPDKSDEYNTLRQELLDHQNRRGSILNLAVTSSAALFAFGAQLHNPLVPLLALPLLYLGRIQVIQTHSAIQRIAAYIRIMLERDNPELNWETGSYSIRLNSASPSEKGSLNISPLRSIDSFLLVCSVVAIALPVLILLFDSGSPLTLQSAFQWPALGHVAIIGIAALIWAIAWITSGRRVTELEKMAVDKREAVFWREFALNVSDCKAEQWKEAETNK